MLGTGLWETSLRSIRDLIRLLGGVLEVRVLQPSILYTLEREMKPRILSKLQAEFDRKAINEVKFRIG